MTDVVDALVEARQSLNESRTAYLEKDYPAVRESARSGLDNLTTALGLPEHPLPDIDDLGLEGFLGLDVAPRSFVLGGFGLGFGVFSIILAFNGSGSIAHGIRKLLT